MTHTNWCKVQFTTDEEVSSSSVYFFFKFSNQRPLCNMVCLNQDPVNFKAFTDNCRCCCSLSVVLHVYAKDECHSWWQNSNFSEREITLIANDSLNIIFCMHTLIAVYIKSGICAICKINCNTKTTKSCHILIYQKKLIWTHILSQPVSFQHYIYYYICNIGMWKNQRENIYQPFKVSIPPPPPPLPQYLVF